MTQNLVITNDSDSQNVQFTVILPEGYNQFQINSINGTMINQNYLKVGDSILFKFANNPIIYYDPTNEDKYSLSTYSLPDDSYSRNQDLHIKQFKGLKLDLFNIYKIKYIPVYYYYSRDQNKFIYIFNPCDNLYLLDEPIINNDSDANLKAPLVEIFGGHVEWKATFTGHFIIVLIKQSDNKIDDIKITIGESIENSKTRLQEMGIHQDSDTSQRFIDTEYIYATNWRYNVSNLLMKHKPTIRETYESNNSSVYNKIVLNTADNYYYNATNSTIFNYKPVIDHETKINDYTYSFYEYDNDNNTWIYLQQNIYYNLTYDTIPSVEEINYSATPQKISQLPYVVFRKKAGDDKYYTLQPMANIDPTPPDVDKRGVIFGSDLHDSSDDFRCYIITNGTTLTANPPTQPTIELIDNSNNSKVLIYDNISYSFKWETVEIEFLDPQQAADISDEDYFIASDGSVIGIFTTGEQTNITYYFHKTNQTVNNVQVIFHSIVNENRVDGEILLLAGQINVNNGFFDYAKNIYPGYDLLNSTYDKYKPNSTTDRLIPLQLTHPSTNNNLVSPAIDDLLVNEDIDNPKLLKFSLPELTNKEYVVSVDSSNVINDIKHNEIDWHNDSVNLPLKCFVPHRFNQSMTQYKTNFTNINCDQGFFVINNINNQPAENINENEFEYFLAEGHKSLIVDSSTIEDFDYKTFNGSIIFDRSSSKITRILSNDITGSCLGYLNDLLSARLSHYYFVSNYLSWNITTDNENMIYLQNAKGPTNEFYNSNDFFVPGHDIIISSAYDIVKLVGSENVLNNITPSLTTEQQLINAETYTIEELNNVSLANYNSSNDIKPFFYKIFHYYTSSSFNEPYNGFSVIDKLDNSGTIGGITLYKFSENSFSETGTSANGPNIWKLKNNLSKLTFKTSNSKQLTLNELNILKHDETINHMNHDTNKNVNYNLIECLPITRIYRNANFEQTDLTISTGGIKTLHPLYIQSTNKASLNNILYMFESIISSAIDRFGTLYQIAGTNDNYTYFGVLGVRGQELSTTAKPILRFCKSQHHYKDNKFYYDSSSFDSLFILDYMNNPDVCDYEADRLPTDETLNTELIDDIKTDSQLTNIQLFSNRYFEFKNEINSILSIGSYRQTYNDAFSSTTQTTAYYINSNNNSNLTFQQNYLDSINSLINGYNAYNQLKNYKMLFSKLGEFLQYPKLIYGVANEFKNSHSVYIMFVNIKNSVNPTVDKPIASTTDKPTIYETVDNTAYNEKQKSNISFGGVVFRYHQQSLGWQQMGNDLNEDSFVIARGEGSKHFILTIYDEFGRIIPNTDTSQGFKNNLKLELTLY